ncbi:MAG: nucleotide sugar dehydrogenase [Candidatus Nanopelagicales bacterium]|nr:nucleotide sugar dehydrogenase [Candidatus Nanopelagicales bacterium]
MDSPGPGARTRVAVLGLGYVGLPLAREACRAGMDVVGYDIDTSAVKELSCGRSRVDDIPNDEVRTMLESGFLATSDASDLGSSRVYVICVPTPLSAERSPDLGCVKSAADTISTYLMPGDLVVLESTTYPGTTEEVVAPVLQRSGLQAGQDFHLAFSPERIDPGNMEYTFRNTPKVVGGVSPPSADAAYEFYAQVCDVVVVAKGTREAELAKLLENTYRHVNIALVNEMVQLSHELGVDLWDSIRCAATKPFGFQPFYPGPGVGGHCIPIDPNYLSHHVRSRLGQSFRFVELAQDINNEMPSYVSRRAQDVLNLQAKAANGSKILLVGVTYKANVSDQRESPAQPLAESLLSLGAQVSYWDPHVAEWAVGGQWLPRVTEQRRASKFDLAILLQPHRELDLPALLDDAKQILDTRGRLPAPAHRL